MGGEGVKVALQRLHVHRMMHHRLRAVHQHFGAVLMGQRRQSGDGIFSSQHVRYLGNGQQAGTLVKQAGDRIQLQRTVLVQRDHPQLRPDSGAQHLPRHDIGVMLHRADDDVVARADVGVSPAVRHEVNAFRGAANKHQFLRRAGVEERRRPLAHLLHARRSFRAEGMNAAMHRRIAVAVKFRLGVNHRFRLLRAGGAVEVGQRLAINLAIEKREIRAHAFHRKCHALPPGKRWPIRASICCLSASSSIASVSSAAKA